MTVFKGGLKELVQTVLPGLMPEANTVVKETRPRRTREPRYRKDLSSRGPIGGHMPIFDAESGAEIMNVVDEGATVTIYYENMDHDGHPQQLIPRQITRGEYLQMLRQQPRLTRKRRASV